MKTTRRPNLTLSLLFLCLATMMAGMTASGAVIIDDDTPLNVGEVLIGPVGVPGAMGPTGVNDDFTNRSIQTGIANVAPGGVTTASGTVVFRNTIQNLGAGDDVFVITTPGALAGFTVQISTNDGDNYVTLDESNKSVTLPISYRAAAIVMVRITAPAGIAILKGFDTVIRATSSTIGAAANETIDRLYTGFIRLDKSATVVNPRGGPALPIPGAEIEFAITYANVSSSAGIGNSLLTAYNLVLNEDGKSTPNNWGGTTAHIVGATDSQGGRIIGDQEGSTSLTDIVSILEAGQSGTFKFKRRIN